ncbi:MAG: T9SS C-terminal target domain-containing protein [Ignavibacteriae bacterium]|nr:MAG: T9SS C-terminal target domain-containing protein [Ignavibacteriota bacterium]
MRIIFIITSLFVINFLLYSQVNQEWIAIYNGPSDSADYVNSMKTDASGNVYIIGSSRGSGTFLDYCTVKYNSSGIQQWVARYNGPGNANDYPKALAIDSYGNVYVTGNSVGTGTGNDILTVKYNSSGVQQWTQRFNGSGSNGDDATAIVLDQEGNVYITGCALISGLFPDYCTIKYNPSGIQQWISFYNGPNNDFDYANSIALDGSGNVYITGKSKAMGTFDYCTVKYNGSGVFQWAQRYTSASDYDDVAKVIKVGNNDDILVTGSIRTYQTDYDYCTIKYNSSGVQQWLKTYNGPENGNDNATDLKIDDQGNVYVTGVVAGDFCTIKYNITGVQQWLIRYNGPGNGNDIANSIAIDQQENLYVCGKSKGTNSGYEFCTIKYNSSGVQQWVQRYTGQGYGGGDGMSVVVDTFLNVYVSGSDFNSALNSFDFCTIKYTQQVGLTPISIEIPNKYFLSQNYPNPFNPSTLIEFSIPKNNVHIRLSVYNVTGKLITILLDEKLNAGTYKVNFVAENLSTGVYFYKMETGDFIESKKMVKIK